MKQKIDVPFGYRTTVIEEARVKDEETREVGLTFSSEEPAERFFGKEILDHKPTSVRLGRLRKAGNLLFNHDPDKHIGRIVDVKLEGKKGHAVVRFSNSALGQEKFQDVKDGNLREVSVGYQVFRMDLVSKENEERVFRANDWEPMEISMVTIPMDTTVGVGRRHKEVNTVEIPQLEDKKLDEEEKKRIEEEARKAERDKIAKEQKDKKSVADAEKMRVQVVEQAKADERERCDGINDLVKFVRDGWSVDVSEAATVAIRDNMSVDEFRKEVMETSLKSKPTEQNPRLGMNDKEKEEYSLVRAIRDVSYNGGLKGLEKEAHEATEKLLSRNAEGFFIPPDIAGRNFISARALGAETATAGGYTVGTEVLGASLIELLRNNTAVIQMGATTMSGLTGNIAIPKQTGGGTATWLAEGATASRTDSTFGQLYLTPKRLVTATSYSKQLLAQSSIDVEAFVRNDTAQVIAIAKDLAALTGDGGDGSPLGIFNTTGINATVTYGGAPTWADMVEHETGIAADNALIGRLGYLVSVATRGVWKTTVKATNTATYLWETPSNTVNGYPAMATTQIPTSGDHDNKSIFGNWADLIMADWEGIDVVVDPFTRKLQHEVDVAVTIMTDNGIRNPVSFNVSTDAANQ